MPRWEVVASVRVAIDPPDMRNWSHRVAIGAGAQRLRRPEVRSRATFQRLLETWGRVLDQSLVPIEAVRPGDQQVVAASYPAEMNVPVISLDSLGAFPEVTSVVASTMIEAHRPLPSIRELFLLADVIVPDSLTVRHLEGLETLFALQAPNDRQLALDALPPDTLRRLAVSRACFGPLESLGRFIGLQELIVTSCRPGDSLKAFSALTELRHFRTYDGPVKAWKALRHCTRLEEALLNGLAASDLRDFSDWTRLRRLTITQRRLRSLAGIESLVALQELHLIDVAFADLAPLRGHSQLSSVSLTGAKSIRDLTALGELPALRRLEIAHMGIDDGSILHVASVRALARCEGLEELHLKGTIVDDADLSALTALPRLRCVRIHFDDGSLAGAAEALRRARPEIEIYYHTLGRVPGRDVGGTVIHRPTGGIDSWWIRADLTSALGTSTNYAAERKLRTALATNPRLSKRLSFDTESSAVVIYAADEDDIRAVADLIGRLARPRDPRSPKVRSPSSFRPAK